MSIGVATEMQLVQNQLWGIEFCFVIQKGVHLFLSVRVMYTQQKEQGRSYKLINMLITEKQF